MLHCADKLNWDALNLVSVANLQMSGLGIRNETT